MKQLQTIHETIDQFFHKQLCAKPLRPYTKL